MDIIYPRDGGYFVLYNLPRNLSLFGGLLSPHILIRDAFFNMGGLHFFFLLYLIGGQWKKYRGPMLYINLVVFPYVLSVLISFSIDDLRNYIAIIPFIVMGCLLYLSNFENSFLRPVDKLVEEH
jgi:hypothetical protein